MGSMYDQVCISHLAATSHDLKVRCTSGSPAGQPADSKWCLLCCGSRGRRSRDDADLDNIQREQVRWGDPMAHLVRKKQPLLEEPPPLLEGGKRVLGTPGICSALVASTRQVSQR